MNERLPHHVRPVSYALRFDLDPSAERVRVRASIALELRRRVRHVELHAVDLEVVRVRARAGGLAVAASVRPRPREQRVRIDLAAPVGPGRLDLDLLVMAPVRSDLSGLYRSERDGAAFLVTQLAPTDARKLFPCVDEPDRKTPFRVSAVVPQGWVVVSNGAEVGRRARRGGRVEVRFRPTRPLPTYLLALCAGPYVSSPVRMVRGVPVRVLAAPGQEHQLDVALDLACAGQAALEDYFGMPYPYDKADHVAVADFAAGAMENAGCITYREALLVADPATLTVAEHRDLANVIVHELSHQWFGNLVTPAWWSDVWLNESFATWMAERILDELHPAWQVWTSFERAKQDAYTADALAGTHAIRNDSERVSEIFESFDVITYRKGAAVLRMLEGFLGRDSMRAGIQRYLRRHADGVARGEDLWRALAEETGADVGRLLEDWVVRPGFPRLTLRRSGRGLELEQARHRSDGTRGRGERPWRVPLVLRAPGGERPLVLARRHVGWRAGGASPELAGARWVVANGHAAGFFRVLYEGRAGADLIGGLAELEPAERAALIGDAWALTRSGHLAPGRLLDLLAATPGERDPVVLGFVVQVTRGLADGLVPATRAATATAFFRSLFAALRAEVGLTVTRAGDEDERRRRALCLEALGQLTGDPEAIEVARRVVDRWLARPDAVDPELVRPSLELAARHGDGDLYDRLDRAAARAPTPQVARTLWLARATFADPELVGRTFSAARSGTVRAQDLGTVLAKALATPWTRETAWRLVTEHFEELDARAVWFTWNRALDALHAPADARLVAERASWLAEHPMAGAERAAAMAIERMRGEVALRARARAPVARWLARTMSLTA